MLGNIVKVRITKPYNYYDPIRNIRYKLNFGFCDVKSNNKSTRTSVFVLGIKHRVRNFEGRIVAVVHHKGHKHDYILVAPERTRFINLDIDEAINFYEKDGNYTLECLYETSCGALVYKWRGNTCYFLLIRNIRSRNWGFPKGHVEKGETEIDTAKREVLEETGLHINLVDGFKDFSCYKINDRIEKNVTIFLATTGDTEMVIQKSEIDDYIWLDYDHAMETLKFENDKAILRNAHKFMEEHNIIS